MTLTTKLSQAPEGSRELDAAIYDQIEWLQRPEDEPPHYTTSIDTALTLVPEGCQWGIEAWGDKGGNGAWIIPSTGPTVYAATPALALCCAAMKAREQSTETDE